ncbi:glycosyltransferase [Aquimarina sp. MMG016]|uniref:glycosyltransferase n=1 Tax=Aquimarina sp. MMG016 TaxID=2822690 RepID=UPI001B3A54A2|nr:glycosyltransferase [Aquimarina sp. MMG016]MBQ4821779.1 glycosyltransferase [Aquimarina sp. MMG016]
MKFSIITITYNRAHLIGETIESVLYQTYSNYELLIIDDGSTDDTKNVVNEFIKTNPDKIKYFYSEKIGFPSKLRNIGLRNSIGDIISILDSDDIWLPEKLFEMHSIFSTQKDAYFVIHNLKHFVTRDNLKEPFYKFDGDFYKPILQELLFGDILAFPVFSMRKSLLNDIGLFDEGIIEGQHDYYLKVASRYPIYYVDKPLTLMRRHGGNYTKNFDIVHSIDAIRTLQTLKEEYDLKNGLYLRAYSFICYKIAKYYLENHDKKEGVQYLNSILEKTSFFDIWNIKSRILKLKYYLRSL